MQEIPTTEFRDAEDTRNAQIVAWNDALRDATPEAILQWAADTFGTGDNGVTLACSFGGVSGMALLDMTAKVAPGIPVFYVDTDFLFPATYATRDVAAARYGLTPLGFRPKLTPNEQAARYGDKLWERDPDLCCALRKVEPNERALRGKTAWIAGLRRDQSATRAHVEPVQWDKKFGLYKICPLWNFSEDDVWAYIGANRVRVNPLHAEGYPSIGCTHCTRAVGVGDTVGGGVGTDLRAGRWSGSEKTECGLHK